MARRRGDQGEGAAGQAEPMSPERTLEFAREIALRRLAIRPHSRAELAAAMVKRAVPEEAIAEVLDRFGEVGLIDDEQFAAAWVRSRHTYKRLSRRVLRQELRVKGVDAEIIEASLETVSRDDEVAAATVLAEKKLRTLVGADRQVIYRRVAGVLGRRGYGPDVIRQVLNDVLDAGLAEPAD